VKSDEVLAVLRRHQAQSAPVGEQRRAAVLVPLRPATHDSTGLEVILIRRTDDQTAHGGQVAFPGGKVEPSDETIEAAALREAYEELGIPQTAVELVGRLDEMSTVTSFHVVPIVGLVAPAVELVPNAREVARVFAVPLSLFLDAARWDGQQHIWRGKEYKVWHFPFDGEDVWGATAHMLRGMVETLWAARR
jgi:8-oxo-dGTP pyrophosphatase MutT (NUDIX family)